jgi:syntaxin-binding protein 5
MQRNTIRAYEYTLPPGAPGGAGYEHHVRYTNYRASFNPNSSQDLLSYRRPSVTALAIHPSGHLFAVGYADGSIAFWAVEDEDQPLSVRTIEEVDVHVVDGTKLEKHIDKEATSDNTRITPQDREPIFKLAWSAFSASNDPRGGETTLTILGGTTTSEASEVTVLWMPAFNPSEPPAVTRPQSGLHPTIRTAMRQTVLASTSFKYYSSGIVQDFLLIPRDSPHFSGSFDPISILLLADSQGKSRAVEAYRFPPSAILSFTSTESDLLSSASDPVETSDTLSQELASTLDSMRLDQDPERMGLPCPLWSGNSGIIGGQILKLDRDSYRNLISGGEDTNDILPFKGGFAWSDETAAADFKLAKVRSKYSFVLMQLQISS